MKNLVPRLQMQGPWQGRIQGYPVKFEFFGFIKTNRQLGEPGGVVPRGHRELCLGKRMKRKIRKNRNFFGGRHLG